MHQHNRKSSGTRLGGEKSNAGKEPHSKIILVFEMMTEHIWFKTARLIGLKIIPRVNSIFWISNAVLFTGPLILIKEKMRNK